MTCPPCSTIANTIQDAGKAQGSGDFAAALPLWKKAVEDTRSAGGNHYEYLKGVAYSASRVKNLQVALEACDQMQAIDCASSDHHFYRGLAYEWCNDKKSAIRCYHLATVVGRGEPMAAEGMERLSR